MTMIRRDNDFLQQAVLVAFDHGAPGQDGSLSAVASTGTLTCDSKANSTARDCFLLNDGSSKALLSYDILGTDAARYSKLGEKAVATLTCDSITNTGDEEYFTVWDGHRDWKVMIDTAGNGDSTGTADLVVDVNGGTDTAAGVAAAVHAILMETTSIPGFTEALHLTSVDNADGTLTLTCDIVGYDGNGANTENAANAWAVTNATGGTDAYPAEEFSHVDVSTATTAIDMATLMDAAINALTEVAITSVDGLDGTCALTNDNLGAHGNTSQIISETGTTLMALTDMTGGAGADTSGATAATKLFTAQRTLRVDKVEYVNPTGLAQDAANFWDVGIKKGATIMAEWSTDSAAEGTLGANTVNDCTLSTTAANLVAAKDDVITFYATKNASAANLPAGRIIFHGRYL